MGNSMQNKPHLKMARGVWVCSGNFFQRSGPTPQEAYQRWCGFFRWVRPVPTYMLAEPPAQPVPNSMLCNSAAPGVREHYLVEMGYYRH